MLKSWKTRALATAGAVALAAPFAFMGGASAAAGTATITSVNSTTGNFEAERRRMCSNRHEPHSDSHHSAA